MTKYIIPRARRAVLANCPAKQPPLPGLPLVCLPVLTACANEKSLTYHIVNFRQFKIER